jgi:hypothetical protein
VPTYSIPLSILTSLRLNTGDGDDIIHISGVLPLVPLINAGGGSDTLILDAGAHSISQDMAAAWSIDKLEVRGTAAVQLSGFQNLDGISVGGGGSVELAPGGDQPLVTSELVFGPTAALDLKDNLLVVRGMNVQQVADLVRSARNGDEGLWTGNGITSSLAQVNSLTTLAVVLNNQGDGRPILTEKDGVALFADDILVKHTWNGDMNLDGKVDADDYFLIDKGFLQQSVKNYQNGDLNYDARIDADDYFLIDKAFLSQDGVLAKPVSQITQASQTNAKRVKLGKLRAHRKPRMVRASYR